jgi:hypothetical protein
MGLMQISVFLENTSGRICEVTQVLSACGINLRAINIADTATFGILRLIVDEPDAAQKALVEAGFTTRITEVIAVEVDDKPGGLDTLMKLFQAMQINIEYLYASLEGNSGKAVIIFRLEDMEKGMKILGDNGIKMVERF